MEKKLKSAKKGVSAKTVVGLGVGIAALSAATYLLFGPNGKKNKKIIKGWTVKMKGEIIEEFEKAKELTEPVYHNIVDKIKAKYSKIKGMDAQELEVVVNEIKKHWKGIQNQAKSKKSKKVSKK
jgi:hypothetical protein